MLKDVYFNIGSFVLRLYYNVPQIKPQPYYVICIQQFLIRGLFPFNHLQFIGDSFFPLFSKQQKKDRYGLSKSHCSTGSTLASRADESPFYLQRSQQFAECHASKRRAGNQPLYRDAVQITPVSKLNCKFQIHN